MFFSVIVPIYNVADYLKDCVESVLSQSFTDFELILVNDGSTDNSAAICDDYAKKDKRVKVIHKENGGQSSARNMGVDAANGEYTVFIDSDDFFTYKDFFADLKEKFEQEPDIVVYRYNKYYSNRSVSIGSSISDITSSDKNVILKELVKRDTFYCSCWSKSVKTKILKENKIRFDEALSCEDMDWYFSVLQYVEKIGILDKECVNYRQRENSVTSVFNPKSIKDYVFTLKKWRKIFTDNENTVLLNALGKLYCNLLISYSAHTSKLKEFKKDIFELSGLLKFNLNPRTSLFCKVYRVFGIRAVVLMLKIISKLR